MKAQPNVKTRFKLYKAGKMWLIAGTTFLALAGLGNAAVHADDTTTNSSKSVPVDQPAQTTAAPTITTTADSTATSDATQVKNDNVVTVKATDTTTTDKQAPATPAPNTNVANDSKVADNSNDNNVKAATDNSNQKSDANVTPKDATTTKSDVAETKDTNTSATPTKDTAETKTTSDAKATTQANDSNNDAAKADDDNQTKVLAADAPQQDGWNADHTQYTQAGQLLTGVHNIEGTYYDFDNDHNIVKNNYVQSQWGLWYMFGNDGKIATKVTPWAGTYYYFDPETYLRVDNNYVQSQWGDWYMFGNDGRIVSGVTAWAGSYYDFDPETYLRVDNNYVQSQWGDWYMFGNDGRIVSGVTPWEGTYYYFDPVTYLRVDNQYVQSQWGTWYIFGNDGQIVKGYHELNGQQYFFDLNNYQMVKEHWANTGNEWRYFDGNGQVTSTDFVTSIANGAIQTWYDYGVLPSVSIAQAILESNWGNAAPGNNLFGIKGSYNGQSQLLWTWEVYNGQPVHIQDYFRAYPSVNESVQDHGSFLYENSRYNNLLGDRDYASVCYKLHDDGYATDPSYANALINVIHASGLNEFDEGLGNPNI
ncbi:glucosaminidase domain-containing protein [Fructilactobacillus frigidiflavus]|uniref:glucosaminidase domain-containing protein n=1 Tax=Fructilactobacillus frigidiflavus TaxID=3242688 RepID=UPI003757120E